MPDAATSLFTKDGYLTENHWQTLPADFSGELPSGKLLAPLNLWLEKDQMPTGSDLGIWLNSDEEVEVIGDQANRFPLIAINFPGFMDGRGFSLGKLLRERYGFTGELRAIGNPIRDQLFFLKRCGFDSFELPATLQVDEVSGSLHDFSITYQGAVDCPEPLFKRASL